MGSVCVLSKLGGDDVMGDPERERSGCCCSLCLNFKTASEGGSVRGFEVVGLGGDGTLLSWIIDLPSRMRTPTVGYPDFFVPFLFFSLLETRFGVEPENVPSISAAIWDSGKSSSCESFLLWSSETGIRGQFGSKVLQHTSNRGFTYAMMLPLHTCSLLSLIQMPL